jgi:hypothetical protein
MRIATAWFLSASVAALGCGSSKPDDTNLDGDIPSNGCITDPSTGAASAAPLAASEKAVGMVCPRGDQDFYAIDVPAGANLLDVSLSYPSALSKVVLQARLFEADGVTQVPNASASDTNSTDGKASVVTTFAVPNPGAYILRVNDASDANSDSVNGYVLQVATALDPDTHEPNDIAAQAKAADGVPGYFSSVGDVDIYQVSIASAGSLLKLKVTNPAGAKANIAYEIMDSSLNSLGTGEVAPAALPADLTRPAPKAGTLFVSLRYPTGTAPDRRAEAGYTIELGELPETDPNDQPPRNDTPATATCLGGAGSPCAAVFSGAAVSFKTQSGTIGSRGDRDYFMARATSAPAVVAATLRAPATAMDLAVDVLVADPATSCKADSDCKVLAGSCSTDDDCELSHHCIDAKAGACTSTNCRQCAASGLCLPLPDNAAQKACGVIIYSALDSDGGMKTGADGFNTVRLAQPVFSVGPVFLIVHDNKDDQYDPTLSYSLDVQMSPEPDAMDSSTDAASRNNFYNPYPLQTTDLTRSQKRAKDISAQIAAGTSVSGFISYQSDEDWFWFPHPCPGKDCGLVFEWVQPGPSPVRPVFLLRRSDLSLHESWTYTGTVPTTAPITDVFGDGDCTECSFASAKHTASGTTPYKYYLQVRDSGADDWDFTSSGRYEFRLKTVTTGCPASCSEEGAGICECFCKAKNQCPASPVF